MNTIAVIDDDVYIGNMLEEVLTKEGYSVLLTVDSYGEKENISVNGAGAFHSQNLNKRNEGAHQSRI